MTTETAVLAGGCFWGMQDLIRKMQGVISTRVGYSGGDVANATYRNHGSHAEAIEVVFDSAKISYRDLLELRSVKSLLDAGIRLELVREVFAYLTTQLDQDVTRVNLVISGSSVMVRTGEEEIVDLLRHGQGVLNILPLSGVKEQVDARIVELYPEGRQAAEAAPVNRAVGH
mgnify:CR=1 FL=1